MPKRKRSGGPKTPEGKAVVRLNPVRHGVLAQTPVIPLVEREEDWLELREGVFEYLGATGTFEEALADRIAGIIWRLYRVVRFESESISGYLQEVPGDWRMGRSASGQPVPDEVTPEVVAEMDRMLMARLLPGDETLDKVMRYETKLHRFLLQTLHQFMVVKGLRQPGGRYYGESEVSPPGFTQPRGPRTPQRVPKYVSGERAEKPGRKARDTGQGTRDTERGGGGDAVRLKPDPQVGDERE